MNRRVSFSLLTCLLGLMAGSLLLFNTAAAQPLAASPADQYPGDLSWRIATMGFEAEEGMAIDASTDY